MAHRLLILIAAPLLAQEYHGLTIIPNAARTTRGTVEFRNQDDSFGVKLRSGLSLTESLTFDLPVAPGNVGEVLKLTAPGVLGFGPGGTGGGWSLTGSNLAPDDASDTLRVVPSHASQWLGSLSTPWNTAVSRSFEAQATAGAEGQALRISNAGPLSNDNWLWVFSRRPDNRQFWIYGYNGSSFSIPLKMDPTTSSVCVACSGSATPTYSLDVNGQIITTGLRASGAGGYVNASQIETRDNTSGLHFGWNANISNIVGIPGAARYVTLQDASSNPLLRVYSHITGPAEPRTQVYGDLAPDVDSSISPSRKLGLPARRWRETHTDYLYLNNIEATAGATQVFLNTNIMPANPAVQFGLSGNRINSMFVNNLDVNTCTGCGGGYWTLSGSALYPSSGFIGLEVTPKPGVLQNLGSLTQPWQSVYASGVRTSGTGGYINSPIIEIRDIGGSNLKFSWSSVVPVIPGARYAQIQDEVGNNLMRWASYVAPGISDRKITAFSEIVPDVDNSHDLGTATAIWFRTYTSQLNAFQINAISGSEVAISASLVPLSSVNLGSSSFRFGTVFSNNIRAASLGGGGNAQACLDSQGNLYRGTPGC